MAFIEFKDVCKTYTMGEVEIKALDNINFTVDKGEFVVILGASGAGKTTILNLLGGMDTISSGVVKVDGKDISQANDKELCEYRRHDIGFVFQFYNLVQNLTALENVELARQICKDPLDGEEVLELVGLEHRQHNFPSQLSGGEQQRVALARALVHNPDLVIADEPTGNIDPQLSLEIMELLKAINSTGTTVLVVTHEHELARRYARRIIEMRHGVIVNDTTVGRAGV